MSGGESNRDSERGSWREKRFQTEDFEVVKVYNLREIPVQSD